jgi:hypothetical protein
MQLWTIQMCNWRVAESKGIELLDTTVKGNPGPLSPTWELVLLHKNGSISDEVYTELYLDMLRNSYRVNRSYWLDVCSKDRLAIACFCKCDKFCHRYILKDVLELVCKHNNVVFTYMGEIK